MKLEAHPDTGGHHLPQQLHVGENPFVSHTCYTEVALKKLFQSPFTFKKKHLQNKCHDFSSRSTFNSTT